MEHMGLEFCVPFPAKIKDIVAPGPHRTGFSIPEPPVAASVDPSMARPPPGQWWSQPAARGGWLRFATWKKP